MSNFIGRVFVSRFIEISVVVFVVVVVAFQEDAFVAGVRFVANNQVNTVRISYTTAVYGGGGGYGDGTAARIHIPIIRQRIFGLRFGGLREDDGVGGVGGIGGGRHRHKSFANQAPSAAEGCHGAL